MSSLEKIPVEWKIVPLNSLLELLTDFEANGSFADVKANVQIRETKNFAWYVRATDIENNTQLDKVKYVTEASYNYLKKTSLYGNELLITKRGEIGKVYYFNKPSGTPCTLAPNLYLLKLKSKVGSKFLYYYFKDKVGNNKLKRINASATIGALYKDDVKNLKILLPPLPEQQKIAEILSTVDEKIDLIDLQIAETTQLKKGLMQRLLTKGIGHTEFKDSPLGKIPKSWEVVKLGDTLSKSPEYGANASAITFNNDNFRYIRITDILENGTLTKTNFVGITREDGQQYELKQDDLLIARTGNTVGKSYLYDINDGNCSFAGYLIRFKLDKLKLNPKYIFQFLHSELFWNWLRGIVRTGAQPNVNSQEYQQMLIPLPTLIEQQKIASILISVDEKLEVLSDKKTNFQELKTGLMQVLLTGKIRVNVN